MGGRGGGEEHEMYYGPRAPKTASTAAGTLYCFLDDDEVPVARPTPLAEGKAAEEIGAARGHRLRARLGSRCPGAASV